MIEKRKAPRETIPEIYQTHMKLRIRMASGRMTIARLLNVSLEGIRLSSSLELLPGSVVECSISIAKSPEEEIALPAKIHYCLEDKRTGTFGIGAEIVQTDEREWVRDYFKIHDCIDESLRVQANLSAAELRRT